MKYWTEYTTHEYSVSKKGLADTIFTFDIETSSLFRHEEEIRSASAYSASKYPAEECDFFSTMYIWMLGINDTVYYGRTWQELRKFLGAIDSTCPATKYFYIHNLQFEFQFLSTVISFTDVFARSTRKPLKAECSEFNMVCFCTYMMTNMKLEMLPDKYGLPVKKQVGDLDYTKVRHKETPLTESEMKYCEYDCLVVYHYIRKELETYKSLDRIPMTSTGHVRKELKQRVCHSVAYRKSLYRAINTNPHVYNLLTKMFAGGYTHGNYLWAGEVIENVDSYDETSAYPYVMVVNKFPMSEFKRCWIQDYTQMLPQFAYILVVQFDDLESKYWNTILAREKCYDCEDATEDNGRILKAKSCKTIVTDIGMKLLCEWYKIGKITILEAWYSHYNYLPIEEVDFILDKYVKKTEYKGIEEKLIEYNKEKNKFNSIYGMQVTATIRDEVVYDPADNTWREEKLSNEAIINRLTKAKNNAFLSFAIGVWVTSYARDNLLRRVMANDKYVIYDDTDSAKLKQGYDKTVFEKYNESCIRKMKYISEARGIPYERFAPKDIKGESHPLGVFEFEGTYTKFKTLGAKKYCVQYLKKKSKVNPKTEKVIRELDADTVECLAITVAGVPKVGCYCLNSVEDFSEDLLFKAEVTKKLSAVYNDAQEKFMLKDYLGNEAEVTDRSGICLLPTDYTLSNSHFYIEKTGTSEVSERSIYQE